MPFLKLRLRGVFVVPEYCLGSRKPVLGGENLRAATRAPVHLIWQVSHLRVATLAGVTAYGIGQSDYRLERLQKRSGEDGPAGDATD